MFVNDAFGTAHREHASNVGISTHLETAAGFLMDKEIKFIGGVVNDPHKTSCCYFRWSKKYLTKLMSSKT